MPLVSMSELWLALGAMASQTYWESAAVLLAIAYLLLAARASSLCWYCALFSTAIYTVLLWHVSLPMESALNVYYMAMAVYGWYQWRHGGQQNTGVRIHTFTGRQHISIVTGVLVLTVISGYLLSQHTRAAWPYVDSFTTWASVVTTVMVARKILENWLYWLVIDSLSIPLYLERGLYQTALLFVIYLFIVAYGYATWRRLYRQQPALAPHAG